MAACANCGHDVAPAAHACEECGCPRAPEIPATARPDRLAVASLAFGIAGVTLIPLLGGIVAIVLGSISRRRAAAAPATGDARLARTGILLGWIGTVSVVVVFGVVFAALVVTARR